MLRHALPRLPAALARVNFPRLVSHLASTAHRPRRLPSSSRLERGGTSLPQPQPGCRCKSALGWQRVPTRVGRRRWRCDDGDSVHSPLRFTSIDEVTVSLEVLTRDSHWGWRRNRHEWVAGARQRRRRTQGQKLPWDPTLIFLYRAQGFGFRV